MEITDSSRTAVAGLRGVSCWVGVFIRLTLKVSMSKGLMSRKFLPLKNSRANLQTSTSLANDFLFASEKGRKYSTKNPHIGIFYGAFEIFDFPPIGKLLRCET